MRTLLAVKKSGASPSAPTITMERALHPRKSSMRSSRGPSLKKVDCFETNVNITKYGTYNRTRLILIAM